MLIVALLDIIWTRHQFEKKIRMTKQEVKDEMKDIEGNPILKSAMRQRARDRIRESLVKSVKEATVVVTNPTHYAVALKYARSSDAAPRVLAKGRDFKALRIREIAKANQIPIIEDKPVARALYASVKEGKLVPVSLYRAVARVLAIVYREQNRTQRREVAQ
jgi:flagellar biosynthetic protein FlhB